MDIFEWAKQFDYCADYYDQHTGVIYHCQEYGKALKFGLPTPGIRYSLNGETLGYLQPKN